MHADDKKPSDRIVVVHAARTPAEVMLAAPLLKHASVFDLRLHYTGDPNALVTTQQTLPCPLPVGEGFKSKRLSTSGMLVEISPPQLLFTIHQL